MRLFKFILRLLINFLVYLVIMGALWLGMVGLFLMGLRFWGASI